MDNRIKKTVRFTADLDQKISDSAGKMGRSFNEEVTQRLRESFDQPELIERLISAVKGILGRTKN